MPHPTEIRFEVSDEKLAVSFLKDLLHGIIHFSLAGSRF
jgi:hypothetical protein